MMKSVFRVPSNRAGTRAATKKAQMKLGLPADSYPTVELLERLGGARTVATP